MKNIYKNYIKLFIASFGAIINVFLFPGLVRGISQMEAGALAVRASDQPLNLFGVTGVFTIVTNTAMFIIGALAVMMLIFGGLKYVVSGGDATKVTGAKNTILYSIVGVIIAMLAYAVINFITTTLATDGSTGTSVGTNV